MAYTEYEDIRVKKVNYRIVPKLRKYYRADGTFDLFDITKQQVNCFRYLTTKGEAGFVLGRGGSASWGSYSLSISSNRSTLTTIYVYRHDNTRYNAICHHDVILKLNNSAGLYPYYVYTRNYSDHNSGSGYIQLYSNASQSLINYAGGSGNRSLSYNSTWNTPSTVWDYKDYDYVRLYGHSADGSKYTNASSWVQLYFVHKFSDDHPLHRYYR